LIIYGVFSVEKQEKQERRPGVCIPWEEKVKELPKISGDEKLVRKVWEDIDALGYVYIWQCLLSF
jgi:predicted RecA/RadA family phage recombinase